jgi:hypothetical protein
LVSVTRKPISAAEDVGRILTMPEKNTAQHADLEKPKESEVTAGRTRR